jgi:hypothetical protein
VPIVCVPTNRYPLEASELDERTEPKLPRNHCRIWKIQQRSRRDMERTKISSDLTNGCTPGAHHRNLFPGPIVDSVDLKRKQVDLVGIARVSDYLVDVSAGKPSLDDIRRPVVRLGPVSVKISGTRYVHWISINEQTGPAMINDQICGMALLYSIPHISTDR